VLEQPRELVRGNLLLVVLIGKELALMGKELAELLPQTPWHLLVVVGTRLLLPGSMSKGLRRVVLHLLLLLPLWDLRLPELARAGLLVLMMVLCGHMHVDGGRAAGDTLCTCLCWPAPCCCGMGFWTERSSR
jgi:hypothetical protein